MRTRVFKVYLSSVEGPNRRGRPLGRWKDRVKEYVSERRMRENGWSGQGGSVWIGRDVEASELLIDCLINKKMKQ